MNNSVAFLNYTPTNQHMRNPTYNPSNRAYSQLKGLNPEKFQFQLLITHYYWKEEKYYKEYIAQFSGRAVMFEKSVFQEDLKTCICHFRKRTGNALTTLPPWSCEQILILMVWAQLLILVSENHSHSVGCNALPSAITRYLSLKVALKHQKAEVSNAIISWLAAIIFCYDVQFILSNYVSNHWFEISIRLGGDTHLQRDKDNNFVPGIDKLFTASQIKGNIFTEEQIYHYSNHQASASSRSERHADTQMTWMIKRLSTKCKF